MIDDSSMVSPSWATFSLEGKISETRMERKVKAIAFAVCAAFFCVADARGEPDVIASARMKPEGPFGVRLEKMLHNHVEATDAVMLASLFEERNYNKWWRTEFWGKYMHSAVPFCRYTGNGTLRTKVDAGVEELLSHQEPCGYIGSYPDAIRCDKGWDVWGIKYTMMGLLHYYDGERGKKALEAAKRLCDYLIGEVGPGGRRGVPLHLTGEYAGMPSCSVLEPVVWLYNRTHDRKYRDFATYIVSELTDAPGGPRLVKQADVPVAKRHFETMPDNDHSRKLGDHALTKAYEMMSCYQGLLEYWQMAKAEGDGGVDRLFDAALKSARSIAETEVNLAGGSAAGEHWYNGADQQYRHVSWLQETCVTITWMRLCEKLLSITHDPFWADQLEKTFYNAYLASMNMEADTFAAYTPLMGNRSAGHHHCKMHTNCCNANGPRGWLSVLNSFLACEGDDVYLNFYMSGSAEVEFSEKGRRGSFRFYTRYPYDGAVMFHYTGDEAKFRLNLRIPAFAAGATVKVNGKIPSGEAKPGAYFCVDREWRTGDNVEICLPLPVVMHRLHDHVAFTRGPLCLARDTRFGDGALDDEIRADKVSPDDLASFRRVKSPCPSMPFAVAAMLPTGSHTEDPDNGALPSAVHFTDYASAGNLWSVENRYRVWLPELIPGRTY